MKFEEYLTESTLKIESHIRDLHSEAGTDKFKTDKDAPNVVRNKQRHTQSSSYTVHTHPDASDSKKHYDALKKVITKHHGAGKADKAMPGNHRTVWTSKINGKQISLGHMAYSDTKAGTVVLKHDH